MSNKKFTTIEKIWIPIAGLAITLILGLLTLYGKSDRDNLTQLSKSVIVQDTNIVITNKIDAPNNTGKINIEQYNNNANGTIKVDKRMYNIKKVTESHTYYINSEDSLNNLDQKENFIIEFPDKNTVRIAPKVGQWQRTFAYVPFIEQERVKMSLSSKYGTMQAYMTSIYTLKNDLTNDTLKVYGEEYATPLTDKMNPATVTFSEIPSIIIFGDQSDKRKTYILMLNPR